MAESSDPWNQRISGSHMTVPAIVIHDDLMNELKDAPQDGISDLKSDRPLSNSDVLSAEFENKLNGQKEDVSQSLDDLDGVDEETPLRVDMLEEKAPNKGSKVEGIPLTRLESSHGDNGAGSPDLEPVTPSTSSGQDTPSTSTAQETPSCSYVQGTPLASTSYEESKCTTKLQPLSSHDLESAHVSFEEPKKKNDDFPGPQDFKSLLAAFLLTVCVLVIAGMAIIMSQSSKAGQQDLATIRASLANGDYWSAVGGPVWSESCSVNSSCSAGLPCSYGILLERADEGAGDIKVETRSDWLVLLWQSGGSVKVESITNSGEAFILGLYGTGHDVTVRETMENPQMLSCSLVEEQKKGENYALITILAENCDATVNVINGTYVLTV